MNLSTVHQAIHSFAPSRALALWVGAVALGAGAMQALPGGLASGLNQEGGPLEVVSAIALGLAAVVGFAFAIRQCSLARVAGAMVLAGLLLRELDFQKRFTYRSIESVGFYTRPIASWTEKALALAILLTLALAAWVVARAAWNRLGEAMQRREAWLGSVTAAGLLVAGSLISEKFMGFTVAEEAFEAGFAGVVLVLAWQTRALGEVSSRARLEGRGRCVESPVNPRGPNSNVEASGPIQVENAPRERGALA